MTRSAIGTIEAPLGEIRSVGGTTGVSITTTAALTQLPIRTGWVSLTPRNFTTAVVVEVTFNPYLLVFKTSDALADNDNLTDYSAAANDGDAATDVVLSSIDTLANGDALYVGSHVPFRGVAVDVDAVNGTASVLTVEYWNGSVWTDISDTDGTIDTGASMGQDGNVTWTIPAAWTASRLVRTAPAVAATHALVDGYEYYWTRWSWSAALDSSTTQNSYIALNREVTNQFSLTVNDRLTATVKHAPGGVASVEAVTDAGTANLIVNIATLPDTLF